MIAVPIPQSSATARATRRRIWPFVWANLPFVLAFFAIDRLPDVIGTLVVGAILFVVPGSGWVRRQGRDGFTVLFLAMAVSLLASTASWLVLMGLPGPTSRTGFLVALAVVTNAGLLRGSREGAAASPLATPLFRSLLIVAALFFVQSYIGAAHRIPAIQDQDMETQGTAYGLIHAGQPTIATNRGTTRFFAHPLLLHYWIGASAFILDDLDRLRYYHEGALQVQGGTSEQIVNQWVRDFAQFRADPLLLSTRTPNIFLGVFVVFPLGFLVYRLTGSHVAAAGAAVLYATLPEVYVRSAYGGYMAIANFIALSAAYFSLQGSGLLGGGRSDGPGARRLSFLAAFLGAWSDQKVILVPMAAAGHAALRATADRLGRAGGWLQQKPAVLAAAAVVTGFFAGWAAYAAYGLMIAPAEFIADHLVGHVVDRIRLQNVNLATWETGPGWYPSIVALWMQFAEHVGWLIAVPMLLAGIWAIGRIRGPEGALLLWIAIGAIGFSLVDWRQTKHLAQILPPLVVLTGAFWASLRGRWQLALSATLGAAICWNVWRVSRLMVDFTYLQPFPIW